MKAYAFFGPSPEPGLEDRLAHRLLAPRCGLDRRLLGALVGRPQGFSELRHLRSGRRDATLTQSLNRLRRAGLVRSRVQGRARPAVRVHELTPLGAFVVFRIAQMSAAHETAKAHLRGAEPHMEAAGRLVESDPRRREVPGAQP